MGMVVQKQAGIQVEGPSPLEAAQMLQQLARSCQHTNAPSRLAVVCSMHLPCICNIPQPIQVPTTKSGATMLSSFRLRYLTFQVQGQVQECFLYL